jgi:hypothetical protein
MTNAAKLAKHRETFARFRPVVFCVRCGSTRLDQNSINELRCYDCDNVLPWDGTLFSIRRYSTDTHDVTTAFETADRQTARRRIN